MEQQTIHLRAAMARDLASINHLIDAAIMLWDLPERVKRLSLPVYHYDEVDLQHEEIQVAVLNEEIVGVIAWEREPEVIAPDRTGLLLHGLYVAPAYWRQGIGSQLLQQAREAVRAARLDGLLVKAQKDAEPFYRAHGMVRLFAQDPQHDYAQRYWLPATR